MCDAVFRFARNSERLEYLTWIFGPAHVCYCCGQAPAVGDRTVCEACEAWINEHFGAPSEGTESEGDNA